MGHSPVWQSESGKTPASAHTPSSAQNNVSFRSLRKPAPSSRHSLNCGRGIEALALDVAARVRFRGKSRLRKVVVLLGMVGNAERRRKMSAAARKRISDAQKARWAKLKAGK